MNIRIKRRNAVRTVVFLSAAFAVAVILAVIGWKGYMKERQKNEYSYQRALLSLSESVDSIDITLTKTLYAGSAEQFAALAAKLCTEAATAKSELSQLPASMGELENVNRFISQVGDYAVALAKKRYLDEDLTDEELKQLRELEKFTAEFRLTLDELLARSADSGVWTEYGEDIIDRGDDVSEIPYSGGSASVMSEDFTEYPTLIYDGPFSDHIYDKKPMMIKDMEMVSKEKAFETACEFSSDDGLEFSRNVNGNLPLYVFSNDNIEVGVTVQGGKIAYMVNSRRVGNGTLDEDDAEKIAERYLREKGFGNMSGSYYEIYSDCCVMNFNCVEDGITMYPDMIKVTVALDNGEVVEFDARDYVMNHRDRGVLKASKSAKEAEKIISRHLRADNIRLAVIPTDSKGETLCWEFMCETEDDMNVLVYVNAENLREEKILLILEDENGKMTI